MPSWVAQYVGLPFESHGRIRAGVDCWGLVKLVLIEQYAIEAPDFGDFYYNTVDHRGLAAAFMVGKADENWLPVETPEVGDVVIFKIAGTPAHCGIVVAPGCMLHARPGSGSCLDGYNRPNWARRIDGFFHHRSRAISCSGSSAGGETPSPPL